MTANTHHSKLSSKASCKAKLSHQQQQDLERALATARQRGVEAAADPQECALIPMCYAHKDEEGGGHGSTASWRSAIAPSLQHPRRRNDPMNSPARSIPLSLAPLMALWMDGTWYERQAFQSVMRGWFRTVESDDGSLYLLRCWMVEPKPEATAGEKFESGNSVLLHYFPHGDQDRALHDHPWDFTTTILEGGYVEALPPDTWDGRLLGHGPEVGQWRESNRRPGQTIERRAEDLHTIVRLTAQCCWTMVRTGARRRLWGFHPPGAPWVDYPAYMAAKAVATQQVA